MGVIVADTTILVDHLRGHLVAMEAMAARRRQGDRFVASTVTRVEVLGGMRSREKSATFRLLQLFAWHPVDEGVADRAGEFARRFRRSHLGMDHLDAIVAATAELVGAELWTRNVKHFPMFEGLEAPY